MTFGDNPTKQSSFINTVGVATPTYFSNDGLVFFLFQQQKRKAKKAARRENKTNVPTGKKLNPGLKATTATAMSALANPKNQKTSKSLFTK